jgi:hypothetical protein
MKIPVYLRVDPKDLIEDAVQRGVAWGYRRAHKHVESPTEEQVLDAIQNSVMSELYGILALNDAED